MAERLFSDHLQQFRLCGAYHPHIWMFFRKYMQQYRLLVEIQQMDVLDDYGSSLCVFEIAFDTVIHLAAV